MTKAIEIEFIGGPMDGERKEMVDLPPEYCFPRYVLPDVMVATETPPHLPRYSMALYRLGEWFTQSKWVEPGPNHPTGYWTQKTLEKVYMFRGEQDA